MGKTFTQGQRFKILAVDDDLSLLRLFEVVMAGWEMAPQLTTAGTGASARHQLTLECPDLLLLDLNLPDVDGLELLRQLRADARLAAATIVAVSGMPAYAVDDRGGLPPGVILTPKPVQFAQLNALAMTLHEAKARAAADALRS